MEGARYKFKKCGDLTDDDNVHRLVDYIYSGEFANSSEVRDISPHWKWIITHVDRKDLAQKILNSDRSERALFTVMMQVFAEYKDKPILGEKTPAHLRYVSTLVRWFPNGKVIHMCRDPRAVFVSELRRRKGKAVTWPYKQLKQFSLPFELYIVLQTTAAWLESAWRCSRYQKRYPDEYRLIKFEDLVREPERTIRQVCAFLGIEFQEKMLEQRVISKGFQLKQPGFDAQAATRWKENIAPWANAWFSLLFTKHLRKFGYAD
jgi:hypothetical protein